MRNTLLFIFFIAFCFNLDSAQLNYLPQKPIEQVIIVSSYLNIPSIDVEESLVDELYATLLPEELDPVSQIPFRLRFILEKYERKGAGERDDDIKEIEDEVLKTFINHPLYIDISLNSIGISSEEIDSEQLVENLELVPTLFAFTDYDLFAKLYAHIAVLSNQELAPGTIFRFSIISPVDSMVSVSYLDYTLEDADVFFEYEIISVSENQIVASIKKIDNSNDSEDELLCHSENQGLIFWDSKNSLKFDLEWNFFSECFLEDRNEKITIQTLFQVKSREKAIKNSDE